MSSLPRRIGALAGVLTVLALSALSARGQDLNRTAVPAASPVRVNPDGTVSIAAAGVAVAILLERLQPVCAMVVRLDGAAGARPVSIEVSGLEPIAAVGAVLKASGLDFAMRARCGTLAQPSLVVVRESGGAPIDLRPREASPDDPAVKAQELPPLASASSPEEEREDRDTPGPITIGGGSATRELAPGELTGPQLLERLAPQPPSNATVIELPFTDQNGHPYLQVRPPGPRTTATLPFPDANGNPIEVVIPPGPRPQTIDFPVANPAGPGVPAGKPTDGSTRPVNPADTRRPRGGGSQP